MTPVTGVNNIQYTAQFGNGVSATIGLDDPTVYSRTNLLNLGALATTAGFTTVAGALQPTAAGVYVYGAPMFPTSSVTSASTRLGVCSRFQVWRIS